MKDILDLCRLNLMEEHVEDSTALAAIDIARRRAVTRIEPPEVTQEMMDRHHEENTKLRKDIARAELFPAEPAGEEPKGAKACGETLPLGAGTHDDPRPHHCLLPAGHEGRHFCHICGIYWDSVEPPPAKDAPTLRDVAKMAAALNTGQDCDPAHHTLVIAAMDALHGPPKPAMDWQAALQHIVIDAERALCNGSTLNRDGANVIHCLKDRAKTALQQAGIAGAKGGTE